MACICLPLVDVDADGSGLFGECRAPGGRTFADADGGDGFTIGVVSGSGEVIGWGRTFYGELPEPDKSESEVAQAPVRLQLPEACTSVACGSNHVLALTRSGRVLTWGWNRFGQAAAAAAASGDIIRDPTVVDFPTEIQQSVKITAVAAGGMHSVAINSSGQAWAWGSNVYGQLGNNSVVDQNRTPTQIALQPDVRVEQAAAGWAHTALVSATGEVFTFGWGLYNQLGHGTTENSPVPTAVDALQGLDSKVVQVACGNWHTAALTASGDLYTWGWGKDDQLGHPVATQVFPRVVTISAGSEGDDAQKDVVDLACGPRCTLALCRDGSIQSWGPKPATDSPPIDINKILADTCGRVRKLATGHSHAVLLLFPQ